MNSAQRHEAAAQAIRIRKRVADLLARAYEDELKAAWDALPEKPLAQPVRGPETGNPWASRGLEWQVSSPPPPGNFATVPVVLSGPYDYGRPDAPPVADLAPPAGVLSQAIRTSLSVEAEA